MRVALNKEVAYLNASGLKDNGGLYEIWVIVFFSLMTFTGFAASSE